MDGLLLGLFHVGDAGVDGGLDGGGFVGGVGAGEGDAFYCGGGAVYSTIIVVAGGRGS